MMRTIGLLGGMSWESSLEYYRIINETVKARLGGLHSAKCVLVSVDFHEIELHQQAGEWDQAGDQLAHAARCLQRAGADCIVLCTNTMHKVADQITASTTLPFLHIADATGLAVQARRIQCIGLLGTAFTMEQDFYKARLAEKFNLQVLVPPADDRRDVHRIIYQELVLGVVDPVSRSRYLAVIDGLGAAGAQGIILGCTEIGLLVRQTDSSLPLFDTTRLHAEAAVDFALG